MTMKRAYSLLEVREVGEESRTITGIATTPKVDSYGDIVEPDGVKYRGPVNLFLYHDKTKPVGNVAFGKATKAGIPFTATIPDVKEEGTVRERVNEAWHSLKYKLIQAVSIGFNPLEWETMKDSYGVRWLSWEMLELSLVGVPANPDAMIQTIKSAGMTDEFVREIRALDHACGGIPLVSARDQHIQRGAVSLSR
jgi:HK97 family phage prohead protease